MKDTKINIKHPGLSLRQKARIFSIGAFGPAALLGAIWFSFLAFSGRHTCSGLASNVIHGTDLAESVCILFTSITIAVFIILGIAFSAVPSWRLILPRMRTCCCWASDILVYIVGSAIVLLIMTLDGVFRGRHAENDWI